MCSNYRHFANLDDLLDGVLGGYSVPSRSRSARGARSPASAAGIAGIGGLTQPSRTEVATQLSRRDLCGGCFR